MSIVELEYEIEGIINTPIKKLEVPENLNIY